jgi:hypothetical protein
MHEYTSTFFFSYGKLDILFSLVGLSTNILFIFIKLSFLLFSLKGLSTNMGECVLYRKSF